MQASLTFLILQVYELPFIVALDHRKEAIVVAVRGTMSLQVTLDPDQLDLGTVLGTGSAEQLAASAQNEENIVRQQQSHGKTP